MSGKPDPKERTLELGRKRYRRIVASPKQWERIRQAKMGPCRVCSARGDLVDLHHIVFRADGGDDLSPNLAPVCRPDHDALHRRADAIVRLFLSRLTDAEYAYMVSRGGEDYAERVYGLAYQR